MGSRHAGGSIGGARTLRLDPLDPPMVLYGAPKPVSSAAACLRVAVALWVIANNCNCQISYKNPTQLHVLFDALLLSSTDS